MSENAICAMLYYLLNYPVSQLRPKNSMLYDALILNAEVSVNKWWRTVLNRGYHCRIQDLIDGNELSCSRFIQLQGPNRPLFPFLFSLSLLCLVPDVGYCVVGVVTVQVAKSWSKARVLIPGLGRSLRRTSITATRKICLLKMRIPSSVFSSGSA